MLNDKKALMAEKIKKADQEADQIFVKNNQTGPLSKYKNRITGQFPKVDDNSPSDYADEVNRVKNQVRSIRVK